jgi:3-phenylpropionate/cinnamic acid dioxygenase small subunit
MAWAEDPPSRTRHIVGNVRVKATGAAGEYAVTSSFLLYRTRLETDENLFAGRREDLLRRVGGSFEIARRTIFLDQSVILAKNLSVFF